MLAELRRRVLTRFGRGRFDAELEEEIQFHLDARMAELQAEGKSAAAARTQALREFGRPARILERSREEWRWTWLEDLASDLGYAVRSLRHQPAFALAAVLCLALGTGANTTTFNVATQFLLAEPSVTGSESLVLFRLGGNSHSEPAVVRFVQQAKPLDNIAGYREGQLNWRNGDDSQVLFTQTVTPNLFHAVGVPVARGRGLQPGDELNGVVVTHRFWQARLDGVPDVLGRKLVLNGRPHVVVGVLPAGHRTLTGYGYAPDVYVTASVQGSQQDRFALVGRLPAGMTRAQALERLTATAAVYDRIHPNPFFKLREHIRVEPLAGWDHLTSDNTLSLVAFVALLMAVVGLILLIACANVSSLLLARSLARDGELAVRMALGAGRGRVVRQLLAETALLAGLGTLAGLGLNLLLTQVISAVALPLPVPVRLEATPDWRLFAYASVVAIGVTLAAGLLPAWQATRTNVQSALKRQERQAHAGRLWWRNALVITQLAACVVLLTTGFLFLRNLWRSAELNVGFDLQHTVYARVNTVGESYAEEPQWRTLVERLLRELRAVPGVADMAYAQVVPFQDGSNYSGGMWTDGERREARGKVFLNWVSDRYFATMGIPLRQGRDFTTVDRVQKPSPVIVNENLARALFGEKNPVGRRVYRPRGESGTEEMVVIGVAAESRYMTLGEERALAFYQPATAGRKDRVEFVVRTHSEAASVVAAVRQRLLRAEPTAAVEVKSLRQAMGFALLPSQAGALALGSMGLLGLLLASVGLYGVLNYAVARRGREIGVRMALGAQRAQVLALVVRDTTLVTGVGLSIGVALAFLATQPLAMFLMPGLRPSDPLNYVVVAVVLGAVALVAAIGPALRALRVNPIVALRYE